MLDHREEEKKWRKYWAQNETYKVSDKSDKPKYYVLDMFPYPSGAGLHVGHPLGYIASDIFARFKRMKGFNVLHPMGFDAFGLPAEEYAIQTGIHPATSTSRNMDKYKVQLDSLGFSFDWSRKICTCDASYYKWTQWIFSLLFHHYYNTKLDKACPITELEESFSQNGNSNTLSANNYEGTFTAHEWNQWSRKEKDDVMMEYRLAYRKVGYVNWCEALGTVLANDDVKDGLSDRGGHPVVQKAMTQWYLRITAYAERLLDGLDNIDWSDALKTIQRNWIGRSEGASLIFEVAGHSEQIKVFTTRPDTVFGATYMVLAPEHEFVKKFTTQAQKLKIDAYIDYVNSKSEIERMAEKSVTGEFTGAYAINPFTNKEIPIWIGEYVLIDYGTGAIMAVPSDDERDKSFATKFGLEIIDVVDKSEYPGATLQDKLGVLINSGFLNGMKVAEAITAACQEIDKRGLGQAKINYKLRDSNFSRQRYWGEPFPIAYDKEGIPYTLPLEELPLILPETQDFKPGKGGKAPLARLTEWCKLPDGGSRETDVMPAVAGSSWYHLRYMDPNNPNEFASREHMDYWQDVDLYVGGAEHAVAHLMYARFWHKFLFDINYVPSKEPYKKLVNQGMITGISQFIGVVRSQNSINTFKSPDGETIELPRAVHRLFISRDLLDAGYLPFDQADEYISNKRVPVDFTQFADSTGNSIDLVGLIKYRKFDKEEGKDGLYVTKEGYFLDQTFRLYNANQERQHFQLHLTAEVEKMSKSKWNVVNPDIITEEYGTDNFRMYEMFLGPIEQSKPWNTQGIEGIAKFSRKLWSLFYNEDGIWIVDDKPAKKESLTTLHKTIKQVEHDIQKFSMNTAISAFMICVNELKKQNCNSSEILTPLLQILAPFAPFITEELWNKLGHENSIHLSEFPDFDEKFLKQNDFTYPICINGKKRALMTAAIDTPKEDLENQAKTLEEIQKWLSDKRLVKTIVVPQKMINFVVK